MKITLFQLVCVWLVVCLVNCDVSEEHDDNEDNDDENTECEGRTAGSDYIDMVTSQLSFRNNSEQYENNVDKCWRLVSELNGKVKIRFSHFVLQDKVNGECVDWLKVTEGDTSTVYCGTMNDTAIQSLGEEITLTFHTDDSITNTGFVAEFYSVDWEYPHQESPMHLAIIIIVLIVAVLAACIFAGNVAILALCKKYKYQKKVVDNGGDKCGVNPHQTSFPQIVIGPLPPKNSAI